MSEEGSWHSPIPGSARAIYSEIERLDVLKERLWAAADDLHRLEVDWSGPAYDQYLEYRDALARRWRHAGDMHDDAAQTLARYHSTLLDIQRRADHLVRAADYGADPVHAPGAWADIERLRAQLQQQGTAAAQAIRACARELAAFAAVPSDGANGHRPNPSIGAAPPSRPISQPRQPSLEPPQRTEPIGTIDPDPSLAAVNPTMFEQTVRVLTTEILIGRHFIIMDAEHDDQR